MTPPALDPPLDNSATGPPAWLVGILLAVGAVLFAIAPDWRAHPEYASVLVATAVALTPALGKPLSRGLDRLRRPSARTRAIVAVGVFVVSGLYFVRAALAADRELAPVFHDEFMELLQARMLARGRLWMPPHPLGDFFDSFFIMVRPVYAATYFPGAALFYVPGVWLHLPPWVTSVLITSAAVALLYLVTAEMIDGVAGLLAALLALSLEQVRIHSVMALSHPALLLLYLAVMFCYLRWRRGGAGTTRWAIAIGFFGGWAAVTRPLDAICLLAPLGCAMLWELRRRPRFGRAAATTAAALVLPALPFLALQLVLNVGVTGHWLRAPIGEYNRRNFPAAGFGFRPPPADAASPSPVLQVRDYYRLSVLEGLAAHAADGFWRTWAYKRVALAADLGLPVRLLFVLLPVGLLAVARPRAPSRRDGLVIILAGAALLLVAYAFWPPYVGYYALMTAPAFILLALLGAEALRRRFPWAAGGLAVGVALLALAATPVLGPNLDRFLRAPRLRDVNAKLARLEHRPAVVLFNYRQQMASVHEEPVYNVETAWPDDAEVIRAHDLGAAANARIFAYYARQPTPRFFYRYDRATGELTPLGWAGDLVKATGSE